MRKTLRQTLNTAALLLMAAAGAGLVYASRE
jgi:hypothetical protein